MQKPVAGTQDVAAPRSGSTAGSFASMLAALLETLRPRQWTKNGLLYLGLLFTVNLYWNPTDLGQLVRLFTQVTLGVMLFSGVASAVYVLNDLIDLSPDRAHPTKRLRPLASGRISPLSAVLVAAALIAVCLPIAWLLSRGFFAILAGYAALQVGYSLRLKHLVIIDVFTIAAGFVLRTVAGAVIINVPISPWLYVCTILGALFLGFAKRRHELLLLQEEARNHRRILDEYSPQLLDEILAVITSSTVMAYSLYTFTAENLPRNHAMMLTIPFVLYGVFRYLYLIHHRQLGGSPEEILLSDRPLIACIALWGVAVALILMVFRNV